MDQLDFKRMEEEEHLIWLEKYGEEKGYMALWTLFKQISDNLYSKFYKNKIIQFELNCPAIMNLSTKNDLNHKERTALLFIYSKLGKKGEERLWEILKQQTNFNENTSKIQIESFKKKNKNLGISCEKLREWKICKEDFTDCSKYKNDQPI